MKRKNVKIICLLVLVLMSGYAIKRGLLYKKYEHLQKYKDSFAVEIARDKDLINPDFTLKKDLTYAEQTKAIKHLLPHYRNKKMDDFFDGLGPKAFGGEIKNFDNLSKEKKTLAVFQAFAWKRERHLRKEDLDEVNLYLQKEIKPIVKEIEEYEKETGKTFEVQGKF